MFPPSSSMSATVHIATTTVKTAYRGSLRSTRRAPDIRKLLKRDERRLPVPHVKNLVLRDTHQSRLQDYYDTLQDDLIYMTYIHESAPRPPPRPVRLAYNPEDPYTQTVTIRPSAVRKSERSPLPLPPPKMLSSSNASRFTL